VRIALDAGEIAAHPLQIGLSMKADVDVRGSGGARLPQLPNSATGWSTEVFGSSNALADARVQAIIAANGAAAVHALAERAAADHGLLASAQLAGAGRHLHH
jgi:membrane fusion protein, multidrug efflux system